MARTLSHMFKKKEEREKKEEERKKAMDDSFTASLANSQSMMNHTQSSFGAPKIEFKTFEILPK